MQTDFHIAHVYDNRLTWAFGKAFPFLQARGVLVGKDARDEFHGWLEKWLDQPLNMWLVRLKLPKVGCVYGIPVGGNTQDRVRISLGDAVTSWVPRDNLVMGENNDALALVESVFGMSVMYGGCPGPSDTILPSEELRQSEFIALSGGGVTAMAEPLQGSFNALHICGLWADEALPPIVADSRPWRAYRPEISRKLFFLSGARNFAATCKECNGRGTEECHVCNGNGTETCNLCDGKGRYKCRSCEGTGEIDCKKCNGTGTFTLRNGKDVDCNACDGSGSWECRGCNGKGRRGCPNCGGTGKMKCRYCKGSGTTKCTKCHGSGNTRVNWNGEEWRTYVSEGNCSEPIANQEVVLFDFEKNKNLSLPACDLMELLDELRSLGKRDINREKNFNAMVEEFTPIASCLRKCIKSADSNEIDPLSVTLGAPEASRERAGGAIVYTFLMQPPIPEALRKQSGQTPASGVPVLLDPLPQYEEPPGKGSPVRMSSLDTKNSRISLSFPVEVDVDAIPVGMEVSFSPPPPPEKAQLRLLTKWLDHHNIDHPVLAGVLAPSEHEEATDRIAAWQTGNEPPTDKQLEAFRHATGPTPLSLIKGPPGTGKTHVIVNIVLDAVLRGQRVLVTSQTHQAVANVLEKIHHLRNGEIPMLRHARDKTKLTEIERRYLSTFSPVGVTRAVGKTMDKYSREASRLRDHAGILETAAAAAERLENARTRHRSDTHSHNEARSNDLRKSRDKAEEARIQRQKTISHDTKKVRDSIASHTRGRKKAQKSHKNNEARVAKLVGKLGANSNKTPPRSTGFFDKIVDWGADLLPDVMASTASLQRRLEDARRETVSQAKKMGELDESLAQCADKLQSLAKEEGKQLAEINQRLYDEENDIHKRYANAIQSTNARLQAMEDECGAILGQAESVASEHNPELRISEMPTRRWPDAGDALRERAAQLERRHDFCGRWVADIEKHPAALATFLDKRTAVFFSTCVGLAGWRELALYGLGGPAAFDLVIVDEAGHATVPETIIPLNAAQRAVLIGDDQQLPPIVGDDDLPCYEKRRKGDLSDCVATEIGNDCWLERSLFSRLWLDKTIIVPRTMLNRQFRMHPDIGEFVSDTFYDGDLTHGTPKEKREFTFHRFQRPLCLVSTSDYQKRHEEKAGTSKRNPLEAEQIRNIIEALANREKDDDKPSLGVISAYKAQCDLIAKEVKAFYNHPRLTFQPGDVSTVDRFQGAERDIIIVSFARSPKKCDRCDGGRKEDAAKCPHCKGSGYGGGGLRFVHDLKRMNVAFSRARRMLILVGDIDALCNARGTDEGKDALRRFRSIVFDKGRVLQVYKTIDTNQ